MISIAGLLNILAWNRGRSGKLVDKKLAVFAFGTSLAYGFTASFVAYDTGYRNIEILIALFSSTVTLCLPIVMVPVLISWFFARIKQND